jgi:hypothetical protein
MPRTEIKAVRSEHHTQRIHSPHAPNADISISKQVSDPVWRRETNKMGSFIYSNTGAVATSRETFYFAPLETH